MFSSLLAYPLNACNGFLVTILIQSAKGASSLPFASVTTPGVPLLLVGLFYAGCVPPVVAGRSLLRRTQVPVGRTPANLVGPVAYTHRRRSDLTS
jgi:hypothetical protein